MSEEDDGDTAAPACVAPVVFSSMQEVEGYWNQQALYVSSVCSVDVSMARNLLKEHSHDTDAAIQGYLVAVCPSPYLLGCCGLLVPVLSDAAPAQPFHFTESCICSARNAQLPLPPNSQRVTRRSLTTFHNRCLDQTSVVVTRVGKQLATSSQHVHHKHATGWR